MASEVMQKSITPVHEIAGVGLSVCQNGTAHNCHRAEQSEERNSRATWQKLGPKQQGLRGKDKPSNNMDAVDQLTYLQQLWYRTF